MSIRVLQLKARNKHKHRTHNARSTYSLNNINSGKLRAPCSSGLQKTAIPQVSHSVRMDRARRGLGGPGAGPRQRERAGAVRAADPARHALRGDLRARRLATARKLPASPASE